MWHSPLPYTPAAPGQIDAMITLYDYTGDASAQATANVAEAATAARAPSRVLAAARAATDTRHPGHPEPAVNATAAPSGAAQPANQPGPIEDSLHRLGVTSPGLLRRGAEIDRAGERLVIEAAAEHEPCDRQPSAATLSRSAGTAPRIPADPHATESPHREAEP